MNNISIITRCISLFIALCAASGADAHFVTHWTFDENQPAIEQGGRANTVAVNRDNRTHIIAASDTGGLFKSKDSGRTWEHLEGGLKAIFMQSVAYVPNNTSVVIATAKADFRTRNGGGVWRSQNGGDTWRQVDLESLIPNFTGRLSAYGITVGGNAIAVATSEGVFESFNQGLNWTYSNVFDGNQKKVTSVLFAPARMYAAGPAGLRIRIAPSTTWVSPFTTPPGGIDSIHAFHPSLSSGHAFVVNSARQLYRTENNGTTWRPMESQPPPGGDACGGIAFVKSELRHVPPSTNFEDVYFSNRCSMWRLVAPMDQDGDLDYGGDWTHISVGHAPRDMDFDFFGPFVLASNGGIHKTPDEGTTWRLAGGGRDGYNALQINEVKGQTVAGTTDLYIGTQDNNLWALTVWGVPIERPENPFPPQGFYIEAERKVESADDSIITFVTCNPCRNRETKQYFADDDDGDTLWRDPPGSNATPVLIKGRNYVQGVNRTNLLDAGLAWTPGAGAVWRQFARFEQERRDLPRLGRSGECMPHDGAIVYQPYRTNFFGPAMDEAQWLIRAHKCLSKADDGQVFFARMYVPATDTFVALGVNPTMFPWYQVYGVDPARPLHIIAPDVINETMMVTTDGGDTWEEIPGLKAKVTQGGELLFRTTLIEGHDQIFPSVTAVSFSPQNPDLVLIGTSQAGIFVSSDNGKSFNKIDGSERITYVTSFYWKDLNTVFVSTYGRGLWRLTGVPVEMPSAFEDLCGGACEVASNDGEPQQPQFDRSLLVFEGNMLGVRTDNGRLREVFVTPASSVVFTGDPNDPQRDIVITKGEGREMEALPKPPDGWIAKGVVFAKDAQLTGTVFGDSEATLMPPLSPETYTGSTESPTKGKPYIRVITTEFAGMPAVAANGSFEIAATDFVAGASYEVLIDGVATKGTVTADGNGSFNTMLTAPAEHGYHRVEVRPAGDEQVLDGSTVLVTQAD